VPCTILTTADYQSFIVLNTNTDIAADGVLSLVPRPPVLVPSGGPSGNGFQLQFGGDSNADYIIQASTDLAAWTNISYGTASNPPVTFSDPDATNYLQRFYRVVLP
jgi:hypothetical protein